jgi:hypothetical protein
VFRRHVGLLVIRVEQMEDSIITRGTGRLKKTVGFMEAI